MGDSSPGSEGGVSRPWFSRAARISSVREVHGRGPKNLLHILGEYHLTGDKSVGELGMAFGMFAQNILGALILFGDDTAHLFVDDAGALAAIWLAETIVLTGGIVVAEVGELLAHAIIYYHCIGLLGDTLKVVGGTGGDSAEEKLFGRTATEGRAYLVEEGLGRGDLAFFGQIPCSAEGFASGHNCDLYKRIGIAQMPRNGGMASLVDGDGALFFVGGDL